MLDGDRVLIAWGQGRGMVVRTVALPRDKIARARDLARNGGSPADAMLPAVKRGDWSSP